MKNTYIKKAGQVLITSEEFTISYFNFDSLARTPIDRGRMIDCEVLALEWASERIRQKLIALEIERAGILSGSIPEPWSLTVDIGKVES